MSRSRDEKGRFIKTPHPKINPPVGAETLERIEHTTPTGKVSVEELEDKQKLGQRLTLIERQILLAYEAKRKHFPESSIAKESRKTTQQPLLEPINFERSPEGEEQPLFETSDTEQDIESNKQLIKMTEEGGGSARGPTPEQFREYEERRRQREAEQKQRQDQNQNPPPREKEESTFKFPIQEPGENNYEEIKMKNIPPSVLPNFYGMASEDPDSFLFEFDIIC